MRRLSDRFCFQFLVGASIITLCVAGHAQAAEAPPVAGKNVNLVSGTTWPGGDPFLQRQNEPACMFFSNNPMNLLCMSNDYRTRDLELSLGLSDAMTSDAWLSRFLSGDGGRTWTSSLVKGCPYIKPASWPAGTPWVCDDPVLQPRKFGAASDPTPRPGTHGWGYGSGIAFSRGSSTPSAIVLWRFYNYNNREKVNASSVADLDPTIIDEGTSGQFLDKTWVWSQAGTGTQAKATCTIPAGPGGSPPQQTGVASGRMFVAWSKFTGASNNIRSQIWVAGSDNCGASFPIQLKTKVSETSNYNLGANLFGDPESGALYMPYRRIANGNQGDAILISKSSDSGNSWSKPFEIAAINPFDLDTTGSQFRNRTFPAGAVSSQDGNRVHVVWAENGVGLNGGDARIVMATSPDGITWAPKPSPIPACSSTPASSGPTICTIDNHSSRGHQYMPAIVSVEGKILITYMDQVLDSTIGSFTHLGGGIYDETRKPMGNLVTNLQSPIVFTPLSTDPVTGAKKAISDATSGLLRRHRGEMWTVQCAPGNPPVCSPAARVTKYAHGYRKLPGAGYATDPVTGKLLDEEVEGNYVNLKLYKPSAGGFPMIGDYNDIAARLLRPDPKDATGKAWIHNSKANPGDGTFTSPRAFIVWTDNRNVRLPVLPAGTTVAPYVPPTSVFTATNGALSVSDPTKPREVCAPATKQFTATRNQDIFGSRVTQPLWSEAFATVKKNLGDGKTKRGFVVLVGYEGEDPSAPNSTGVYPRPANLVVTLPDGRKDLTSKLFRLQLCKPNAITGVCGPVGADASFEQFSQVDKVEIPIRALSTMARMALVTPPASGPLPKVAVNVCEIDALGVNAPCGNLKTSVILNEADASNLVEVDVTATTGENYDPELLDPRISRLMYSPNLGINVGDPTLAGGDPTLSGGDPTMSGGDPTMSGGDPTMSGGDPTLSGGDPTLAGGDPTLAGGDPTLSGGDPTLSGGDPTIAGGDPTMAGGDPTLSGGDPTLSGGDRAIGDATWPLIHIGNAGGALSVKRYVKGEDRCINNPATGTCPKGSECVSCLGVLHKLYGTLTTKPDISGCSLLQQVNTVVFATQPNPPPATAATLGTSGATDPTNQGLGLAAAGFGRFTIRAFGRPADVTTFLNTVKTSQKPATVAQAVNSGVANSAPAGCGTGLNPPCPLPAAGLLIKTTVLPVGIKGQPYQFSNLSPVTLESIGGSGTPRTWSGSNLDGLTVNSPAVFNLATGLFTTSITGSPSDTGTFTPEFTVRDAAATPHTDASTITLQVNQLTTSVLAYQQEDFTKTDTVVKGSAPAQSVTVEVTVTNTGPATASGVAPSALTVSPVSGTGAASPCVGPSGGLPTIAPNSFQVYTYTCGPVSGDGKIKFSAGATGNYVNAAGTTSGAAATTSSNDITVVSTPPTISATATANGSPYTGGTWTNQNVTVTFTCTAGLSGITVSITATGAASGGPNGSPLSVIVTGEGDNQSVTGTCTDAAGNSASTSFNNIRIDKTKPNPPTVSVSPIPNLGWNNTDVNVSFTSNGDVGSAQSGVASCSPPVSLTSETSGTLASGTCTDAAGNTSDPASVLVKIDKTAPNPPVVSVSPAPNLAGWNKTNPTVSFAAAGDAGAVQSGVLGCSAFSTVTVETPGTLVSGTCTDVAGNTSVPASVNVKLDKTAPTAPITSPALNASYTLDMQVASSYSCADALSGLATCVGQVPSGTNFDTTLPVGIKTFTVTATDVAGNTGVAMVTYNVVAYTFVGTSFPDGGFFGSKNRGAAVPFRWQLKNTDGTFISDLNTLIKITARPIGAPTGGTCPAPDPGTGADEAIIFNPETGFTGGSDFRFSTTTNEFQMNWNSEVGTSTTVPMCYTVMLHLKDNPVPVDRSKLKKTVELIN